MAVPMSAQSRFALFDTPIGVCAVVWKAGALTGVQLPEATAVATRARVTRRFPGAVESAPSAEARQAIGGIVALLSGKSTDLSGVPLDMDGVPAFHRQVYDLARTIPPGATLSYGDIATRLGRPGGARAVGQALGRNPFAIVVPCHRVLAAGGGMGGFSAGGGVSTKRLLLAIEGASGFAGAPPRLPLFD